MTPLMNAMDCVPIILNSLKVSLLSQGDSRNAR